jgi:uncharacterized RDD family membrane protein YckC
MSKPQSARDPSPVLYANFPRRLKGLTVDLLVIVSFSMVVAVLAPLVQESEALRVALVLVWWLGFIFYEPFSVWLLGGTIGHRAMNLCVVDNRTGQNISPIKALIRLFVKGFLGLLSFLTMTFTRRHQAVHDILTNTSVRIRNPKRAMRHQYTLGRS